MELKHMLTDMERKQEQGFNRTFMELKQGTLKASRIVQLRFNRTFMELKLHNDGGEIKVTAL